MGDFSELRLSFVLLPVRLSPRLRPPRSDPLINFTLQCTMSLSLLAARRSRRSHWALRFSTERRSTFLLRFSLPSVRTNLTLPLALGVCHAKACSSCFYRKRPQEEDHPRLRSVYSRSDPAEVERS